jgi:hypothetical protein
MFKNNNRDSNKFRIYRRQLLYNLTEMKLVKAAEAIYY